MSFFFLSNEVQLVGIGWIQNHFAHRRFVCELVVSRRTLPSPHDMCCGLSIPIDLVFGIVSSEALSCAGCVSSKD
jgi:hypothetical protein